jgi:hypothetical protein
MFISPTPYLQKNIARIILNSSLILVYVFDVERMFNLLSAATYMQYITLEVVRFSFLDLIKLFALPVHAYRTYF